MTPRVLLWVQHLVGVGHQRRAAAVARELARAGAEVCYLCGGLPVAGLDLSGCALAQLPAARSLDMRYHTLVDEHGRAVDAAWRARRCAALLGHFAALRPHVVITETWPFGRGLLRFELGPLMDAVERAHPRPLLVSSVRDIVEQRDDAASYERMARRVQRHFDLVLVHADPALVPFEDSFPLAHRIASRLRYTGYVSTRAPLAARALRRDGAVVVSAGGGFFGEQALRTAIAAAAMCELAPRPWYVLAGPNLAQDRFAALARLAGPGVSVQRNREDFHRMLDECAVSVSQAGYNTVVDLLAARVPAVLLPYADEREREQLVRARHLAARGLAEVVEPDVLDPARLAAAVAQVVRGEGMPAMTLDLDGARASARIVLEALQGRAGAADAGGETR
jgi:predicted glycosyltransferase